jgi:hypothetical protein
VLRNIDTALDLRRETRRDVMPTVTEKVTMEPVPKPNTRHTFLGKAPSEWDWEALRDYVIDQIEAFHGPSPRKESHIEAAIFKRFWSVWGTTAVDIVQYAFGPECNGIWRGAPISVNRFTKSSDPYFAQVIVDRLGLTV